MMSSNSSQLPPTYHTSDPFTILVSAITHTGTSSQSPIDSEIVPSDLSWDTGLTDEILLSGPFMGSYGGEREPPTETTVILRVVRSRSLSNTIQCTCQLTKHQVLGVRSFPRYELGT